MATPTTAAAATAASAATPTGGSAAAHKNTPQLHSVATSLRSSLDGMLPDTLRNDATAFQQHLAQQKARVPSEKNTWRFGLNYIFETLKQHKDWYGRNQQFVQLGKDVKRLEAHVATMRSVLSESVSKLDLEAGLRVAELEGRVGAYKIMFEVTKIVTKLSRPLVKLQILKPSESSLSIYCDTFVLDIVLAGGEGAVESASLMTVEKDVTKQFPERDEDLLHALQQLAAGESSNFTEKLVRLINRAELAVKYPDQNFEQLEEEVYEKLATAAAQNRCWSVKRVVDGVAIHFKDALHCLPIAEPPRKKMKIEEPSTDLPVEPQTPKAGALVDESLSVTADAPTPLAHGEWEGCVSFIEWRGEVTLHVVGYTPLVMVGVQARRLALAVMRKSEDGADGSSPSSDDEKLFNDFVSWVPPSLTPEETRKAIAPQLHFTRDRSLCNVSPPSSSLKLRQEYSLVTKEISGGLQLHAFPIPLSHASETTLNSVFQICGHSLLFHSVLLSAFASRNNTFGQRIPVDCEDAIHVPIKVDVSAPERITLKTDALPDLNKQVLIEFGVKSDGTVNVSTKVVEPAVKAEAQPAEGASAENHETMDKLSAVCHSVPLLTYYALQRVLQQNSAAAAGAAANANDEDCSGIVTLDDGLEEPMKIEGGDILLDDMSMF
ncbi:hypothetical protein Poli38472_008549 [Pythium oligandrum]|uniref:Mediator of RNA polymerase II transcription subunit 1 n=1 Tax=Pythium oligandrum TaxID=41045 RepID=A0A8K1C3R3_PYTOL|nr:hypothetical protein Poli38472_008549 [Pythium oligandrum]|eukprot:TMW55901.1 hypothetical protein Poli38472_008549 [Pythium oligandrum]